MLTLLSPQPKPLPETIYLMSDVQFMDSNAWRLFKMLKNKIVNYNLLLYMYIFNWLYWSIWVLNQCKHNVFNHEMAQMLKLSYHH